MSKGSERVPSTDVPGVPTDPTSLYEIRVRGTLDPTWNELMDQVSLTVIDEESQPVTVLRAVVQDQAAMAGLLDALFALNATVLSVEAVESDSRGGLMKYGPVDVVVLASGHPRFDGSILGELERLASTKTIRVLDAMLLARAEDGARLSLDIEDLPAEAKKSLGFIETGTRGLFDAEDADMLWEGMVPGSAVVALAVENTWAVTFLNSIEAAGVELAMHWRIPAPIVDDALADLAK